MIRQLVSSSNIESVGYDRGHEILEIEFPNGNIYQYFNVPITEYWGLMQAESKGEYFADHIKDKYPFEKVN